MKKGHLRLVVSDNTYCAKKGSFFKYLEKIRENVKCIITSRREKIYVLKDSLIRIYRDYEISTGISDIPYYIRAEMKINKIIEEDKVDYYFNLFEKFRKNNLY